MQAWSIHHLCSIGFNPESTQADLCSTKYSSMCLKRSTCWHACLNEGGKWMLKSLAWVDTFYLCASRWSIPPTTWNHQRAQRDTQHSYGFFLGFCCCCCLKEQTAVLTFINTKTILMGIGVCFSLLYEEDSGCLNGWYVNFVAWLLKGRHGEVSHRTVHSAYSG